MLGNELNYLLKKHGITQQKAAESLGITRNNLPTKIKNTNLKTLFAVLTLCNAKLIILDTDGKQIDITRKIETLATEDGRKHNGIKKEN